MLVASAATLGAATVLNGDFSSPSVSTYNALPPTDFTGESGFNGGVIVSGYYPDVTYSTTQILYLAPNTDIVDGVNVGGTGGVDGIYQDLGALQANTNYTVTVAESEGSYGDAPTFLGSYNAGSSTFQLDLYNGVDNSTAAVATTDTPMGNPSFGAAVFTDETVTFTTGATVSGYLTLGLSSFDTATQTSGQDFFANVRLATTSVTTPEPSSYALVLAGLGALVLVARLRRRA